MSKNVLNIPKYIEYQNKKLGLEVKLSSTVKGIAKSIYKAFSKKI